MGLINKIKEYFMPQLPVNKKILEREKNFNEQDPSRESWVLANISLCRGDLNMLKTLKSDIDIEDVITYYATPKGVKGPCKKVRVSIEGLCTEETIKKLENKLKLDLFYRGCNSGVFYRCYKQKGKVFAEAIPAILDRESF